MSQPRKWSFFVLPDAPDASPYHFQIGTRTLKWALGGGIALLLAVLFIAGHYFFLWRDYQEAAAKARQYEELKSDFFKVQEYAFQLQSDLDEMSRTVEKLQMMAGTISGQTPPPSLGVGGESLMQRPGLQREALLEQQWALVESQQKAAAMRGQLETIEQTFRRMSVALSHTPSIRPVFGYVISGFGTRRDPFTGAPEFHQGVDISAPYGTPVVAAADGVVIQAGRYGGFGWLVVIDHGMGIHTYYAHLSKILVRRGARVKRWEIVGLVGNSGRSTAPHLHYEIRYRDTPLNPMHFILGSF